MDFLGLLQAYSTVPKRPIQRTFLEIAGIAHHENVWSNILQFFLEPQNEHGLDNLVLTALSECLGKNSFQVFPGQKVVVEREVTSLAGGRMDLVIETPTHLIVV